MLPGRRRAAAAVFWGNVSLELALVAAFVCGPTFQRVFESSSTRLGVALGAGSVGMLVMALFVGRLTRRLGPFRVLLIGLTSTMAGAAIVASAPTYALLLCGLAMVGAAGAFIANANVTLLAELFRDSVRRVMSFASAVWFGGSAVCAPLMGLWLEKARRGAWGGLGFRSLYLACIVLLLASLVLAFGVIRPAARSLHKRAEPHERSGVEPATKARTGVWLWIPPLAILHGLMVIVPMAWVNPMVQIRFGATEQQGAVVFGGMALGLGAGRLLFALLNLRADDRLVLGLSGLAGGLALVAALRAPTYGAALIMFVVFGLFACATLPCILSLIGTRFAREKEKLYGYMKSSIALAGLGGPPLVGALADSGVPLERGLLISVGAAWVLGLCSLTWKLIDGRRRESEEVHDGG